MNLIPYFLSDMKARQMLENLDFSIEKLVIEALRLQGPLWVLTKSYSTDIHLMNHFIPKDYKVKLCVFSGNRDAEVFENADLFDPARRAQPLLYSRGIRRCPGEKIANQILFAFFNVFREHLPYVKPLPLELTRKHVGNLEIIRAFKKYHVRTS
jgi:cytochrome P450